MMEFTVINTISEVNRLFDYEKPEHPLVSVIDFGKVDNLGHDGSKIKTGLYCIMLKDKIPEGKFRYGREYYDFQEGTIIFLAPEQVILFEGETDDQQAVGWGLFFHPDFLRKSYLAEKMKDYSFFTYEVNEALHLSEQEKQSLTGCVRKIEFELSQHIDNHSQTLILSNIELLLNYCARYYERQFTTRVHVNKDVVSKFEKLLLAYFDSDVSTEQGLPTVKYCAEKMCLSPNYLSDLLKKETGKNTQEHIHYFLIEKAKNLLLNSNHSVSEIAYELGFEYPQYFSKIFKSKTGITPAKYRILN